MLKPNLKREVELWNALSTPDSSPPSSSVPHLPPKDPLGHGEQWEGIDMCHLYRRLKLFLHLCLFS